MARCFLHLQSARQ